MTTTEADTTTYQRPADSLPAAQAEEHSTFRFPELFWAGSLLFAANLLILVGVGLSPRLQVTMYGEEAESIPVYYRPSPFAESVQTAKAPRAKSAPKARPVLYEQPPVNAYDPWQISSWEQYGQPSATAYNGGNLQPGTTFITHPEGAVRVYQTAAGATGGGAAAHVAALVSSDSSVY